MNEQRTVTLSLKSAKELLHLDPMAYLGAPQHRLPCVEELRVLVDAHMCHRCEGEGTIHTGIEESPSCVCPDCLGTGETPLEQVRTRMEAEYDLDPGQEGQFRLWLANREDGDRRQCVEADNTEQALVLLDFALSFALCNREHTGTRRDVKKAQGHLAQVREFMAKDAATINLNLVDMEAITKAASENTWMPEQYMRNDWVADVCAFLRDGPGAYGAVFSFEDWTIDNTAGRPILMHKGCSVIEAEQAYGLLHLIATSKAVEVKS